MQSQTSWSTLKYLIPVERLRSACNHQNKDVFTKKTRAHVDLLPSGWAALPNSNGLLQKQGTAELTLFIFKYAILLWTLSSGPTIIQNWALDLMNDTTNASDNMAHLKGSFDSFERLLHLALSAVARSGSLNMPAGLPEPSELPYLFPRSVLTWKRNRATVPASAQRPHMEAKQIHFIKQTRWEESPDLSHREYRARVCRCLWVPCVCAFLLLWSSMCVCLYL